MSPPFLGVLAVLYRAIAGARRRRAVLLGRRRGSRLGGIPSFSAAVSEAQS